MDIIDTDHSKDASSSDSRSYAKPPKWHLLYFALAAFDILAISSCLTLNHYLVNLFNDSITITQQWANRLADYSEINILAQQVNAPGNDVFDSQDTQKESKSLHEALERFNLKISEARLDLENNATTEHATPLTKHLDQVQQTMDEMVGEAELIFTYFQDNRAEEAGSRMATMDRKYGRVTQAISAISLAAQEIESGLLASEKRRVQEVAFYEYFIAILLVVMIVGIAVYGHKIQKAMTHASQRSREDADTIRFNQKKLEAALAAVNQINDALNQHCIVSIADVRGDIIEVNDKFCEISGYERHELIGQNHRMLKSDTHDAEFYKDLWGTIAGGDSWNGVIQNKAKSGDPYWVDATIAPFRGLDGKIEKYVAIRTDVTDMMLAQQGITLASVEAEKIMEELERVAATDKLTGLVNRGIFLDRLDQAMKQSTRNGSRFAVLFFDFDRFKVVNDSLGHDVGDALLCDIADIFRRKLRESDTAARFGGDEFVVLLNNLAEYSDATLVAENLLEVFAETHELAGHRIVSTASIGLVTSLQRYNRPEDMIRDADSAMYQAKALGKAQVVEYDKKMHEQAMDRLVLENDLRTAIANREFALLYQPIIDLENGEILGFEALIRWEHPERGIISPLDFIPIAEDTGLIVEIGRWVLQTAARQISDWNDRLDLERELTMSINVSKRQLLSANFKNDLIESQKEFNLDPQVLKLEITESVIIDERANVAPLLHEIRDMGFPIVMDDFGTGVSSLGTLHNYPIDVLKIDQAFIRPLDNNRELLAIVAAITSLAENLGIVTVAEGIETVDVVGSLQSINCNLGQGYYFAKPLRAEDAEEFVHGPKNKIAAA